MAPRPLRVLRLASCLVLSVLAVAACDSSARVRSSETSHTIGTKLIPSSDHPFTGLWRRDCDNNFGLAVQPAGPSAYSISFCGPGGCFEPGTYRLNSPIEGDPQYRIVDSDTIEVSTTSGFQTYHRCGAV